MTRVRDDFVAAELTSVEDIRDRFCTNFFWGCEADDPLVGVAFDPRVTPLGALVPAFFASDLGHWDVPEFDEPLEEAFELVERGILDADQLRDFLFVNPARFYASLESRVLRRNRDRAGSSRGLGLLNPAFPTAIRAVGQKGEAVGGRLEGKVAIVTGAGTSGAGVGIGHAISIVLGREGASVLVVDKDAERAAATLGAIEEDGGRGAVFVGDVSRPPDCEAMVGAAIEHFGGLDILVNNAAISIHAPDRGHLRRALREHHRRQSHGLVHGVQVLRSPR